MPVVRRSRADIDRDALLAELAAARPRSEAEIAAEAAQDGDAWSEADVAQAVPSWPPPTPAEVRALRVRLGLSQVQFARRFGFTLDTLRQYEQGRRTPSGPAATLLRVIAAEPDAVSRALQPAKPDRRPRVPA